MKKITSYSIAALLLLPQLAFAQEETTSEELSETTAEMNEGEVVESTETLEGDHFSGSDGRFRFNEKELRWAAEGALSFPTGVNHVGVVGFGAFGRGEYALQRNLHFTGRVGILLHPLSDVTMIQVPVLFGVRFYIQPEIFVNAELGLSWLRLSMDGASDSDLKVPIGVGGGYVIDQNLAVRVELFCAGFFEGDQILVAAAYRFDGF